MNLQPASKGPFETCGQFVVWANGTAAVELTHGTIEDAEQDARYFAHAANVLPGCVEAMAEAYADIGSVLTDKKMHAALAKLKAALDAARKV